MKTLKLIVLSTIIMALFTAESIAQCVYSSDMEEPTMLYSRHGGWGPVFGGADNSDLGHWLGWVSDGIHMADGADGLEWGWEEIEPISGERSLKAEILSSERDNPQTISALTIIPLLDYTKDYELTFDARVTEDWPIEIVIADEFLRNDAKLIIYRADTILPDGDSQVRFLISGKDLQAGKSETADDVPASFDINLTRIEVLVGRTGSGKFLMDNVCLKEIDLSTVNVSDVSKTQLRVFPNPASSEITIDFNSGVTKVEILNIVGQIVKQVDVLNQSSANISISDLNSGMYVIKTKSDNNIIDVSKFIKE